MQTRTSVPKCVLKRTNTLRTRPKLAQAFGLARVYLSLRYIWGQKRAKPFSKNPIVDNDVVVDSFYVPQNEDFNNLSGIVLALSGEYFEPTAAISFISKKEDVSKV